MEDIPGQETHKNEHKINFKKRGLKSVNGIKRKKMKTTHNIPSAEEIDKLREAETMFHSNFFKMQFEELMKEINSRIKEREKIQEWIQNFKDHLCHLPESSHCAINDFNLDNVVQVPIIQYPKTVKGVFKFIPPESVREIGSYMLGTLCSAEPVIDIAVEIPKACWQKMDHLNQRYHRKRALYLAYIAKSVLESNLIKDVKFMYQNECYLKPVLLMPTGINNVTISVTAYPAEGTFKYSRFIPSRNNVRSSWLLITDSDLDVPTPFYNASVLADVMIPKLQDYLEANIISKNIKDGIILIKLWCMQRRLLPGYGRINGFMINIFVAYLIKKRKISPFMSAYQVFRCALIAFQNEDLEKGITLSEEANHVLTLEDFQSAYKAVFVDPSGFFNMCYSVTTETLSALKHEAKLGLQVLDKELPDCFSLLFMNKITFSKKFEYLLHLKGPKQFKKYCKQLNLKNKMLDFGKDMVSCVVPKICSILKKGLNSRILLLDVYKVSSGSWPVSSSPPSPNKRRVTIGFLLNPEVPLSNLEKGPVADAPEAKEFRKFWGERSELRRFQDGSIREAVFWPAVTTADKRKVFKSIIKDILKRHLNVAKKKVAVAGTEVDCILHMPDRMFSSELPPNGTGEEAHITIMQSFSSLSKQLRTLDLPLLIASMQGVSPAFRFAEVFPPVHASYPFNEEICYVEKKITKLKKSNKTPPYIPALKVVISFEGSGKWPDSVEAIKRVKTAFLIKIAELVQQKYSLIAVPFLTHVDILKDGYIFRIEIACHKELFLLKQLKTTSGSSKSKVTKDAFELEIATEILPKLNSTLHGFHQQHNTFGTACRLAKRWISSQLNHGLIKDLAVDLIMTYIYIHPEPYICPSTPQVAFIRFLSLLITHDWKLYPLVINLNDEFTKNDIDEISSSFISLRPTLPPMVLVTPLDRKGVMWTRNRPTARILKRIIMLARASLKNIEKQLYDPNDSIIKVSFRPSFESFDVLIHLKHGQIPKRPYAIDVEERDGLIVFTPYKEADKYPVVEYDPVREYLEELKANFGKIAHFLYDTYGGDIIAAKWKKSAFIPKEFKVSRANYRTLHRDGVSTIPDIEVILEDFKILGLGLVDRIEKQLDQWQLP